MDRQTGDLPPRKQRQRPLTARNVRIRAEPRGLDWSALSLNAYCDPPWRRRLPESPYACECELDSSRRLVRGNGAERQLAAWRHDGDLRRVTAKLADAYQPPTPAAELMAVAA